MLVGLEHRLSDRRAAGRAQPAWEATLRHARSALAAADWPEAERALFEVESNLRATDPESELREYPRGLVRYTPRGDRGIPPEQDEDPLANRIDLASRLIQTRSADGADVSDALQELRAAETALRLGDRTGARERCDAAFRALEGIGEAGAQR